MYTHVHTYHMSMRCNAIILLYYVTLHYNTLYYIGSSLQDYSDFGLSLQDPCSFPLSVAVLMPYALCCTCYTLAQCKWCQCKGPWYCSKDCQKEAYKEHKPQCAVVVAKQELELRLCKDIAHEVMRYAFKH